MKPEFQVLKIEIYNYSDFCCFNSKFLLISVELYKKNTSQSFNHRYKASKQMGESDQNKSLPLFTSSCPGWVCYVENTHGKLVIPYMSSKIGAANNGFSC